MFLFEWFIKALLDKTNILFRVKRSCPFLLSFTYIRSVFYFHLYQFSNILALTSWKSAWPTIHYFVINYLFALLFVSILIWFFPFFQGAPFKLPTVEKKVLDLYTLHKVVAEEGGFETCTRERKWSKVAHRMNFNCK